MASPGAVVPAATLTVLDRCLDQAPPGLAGRLRLVCIDGPAGSGKTTLGNELGRRWSAPVVHMDDLFEGWDGADSGVAMLHSCILEPLDRGEAGWYERYDWVAGRRAERRSVEPSSVLIVEGCHSARRAVDRYRPLVVWVSAPDDVRLRRGLARDGLAAQQHWSRWMDQERASFAEHGTCGRAGVHLDGEGRIAAGPGHAELGEAGGFERRAPSGGGERPLPGGPAGEAGDNTQADGRSGLAD